ncbi:MAG: TIGR00159 family protein, partial [Deltaproteobacteria bacterium]|nr:TIGR00159 family protein [Deltaproteobacteria bacterium]
MITDLIFHFRWQDVIDILVISFIIQRLFLLLKGTTALQITLGLVSLWIFHAIAQAIGLVLTSWFFQG